LAKGIAEAVKVHEARDDEAVEGVEESRVLVADDEVEALEEVEETQRDITVGVELSINDWESLEGTRDKGGLALPETKGK
jgi:hypothetical protein